MTKRWAHGIIGCLAVVVMLTATPGCKKDEAAKDEPAKEAVTAAKETEATAAGAVEAKLVAADSYDGTADKIISKCPSCNLMMDGKAEHTAEHAGYEIRFCTADCKTGFEKDIEKSLMALVVPEKD